MSPNVKVKEYGNQTGMHVAASYGILAALHVLVLAGATIDMTDTQLMTPLMVAITKEQNDVVHYLIQAGASLMAKVSKIVYGAIGPIAKQFILVLVIVVLKQPFHIYLLICYL